MQIHCWLYQEPSFNQKKVQVGVFSATGALAASAQPAIGPSVQEMRDSSTLSQSCLMPGPPCLCREGRGQLRQGRFESPEGSNEKESFKLSSLHMLDITATAWNTEG